MSYYHGSPTQAQSRSRGRSVSWNLPGQTRPVPSPVPVVTPSPRQVTFGTPSSDQLTHFSDVQELVRAESPPPETAGDDQINEGESIYWARESRLRGEIFTKFLESMSTKATKEHRRQDQVFQALMEAHEAVFTKNEAERGESFAEEKGKLEDHAERTQAQRVKDAERYEARRQAMVDEGKKRRIEMYEILAGELDAEVQRMLATHEQTFVKRELKRDKAMKVAVRLSLCSIASFD
jgi:hypothetical protein